MRPPRNDTKPVGFAKKPTGFLTGMFQSVPQGHRNGASPEAPIYVGASLHIPSVGIFHVPKERISQRGRAGAVLFHGAGAYPLGERRKEERYAINRNLARPGLQLGSAAPDSGGMCARTGENRNGAARARCAHDGQQRADRACHAAGRAGGRTARLRRCRPRSRACNPQDMQAWTAEPATAKAGN